MIQHWEQQIQDEYIWGAEDEKWDNHVSNSKRSIQQRIFVWGLEKE